MATNLVFKNDNKQNRVVTLAATYGPGVPVIANGSPAVTITGSGDYTKSEVIPGVGTLSGVAAGGVGLAGKEVSVAFSGTWEFPVADITGIASVAAAVNGETVYITSANALTTTAGTNLKFGTVDFPKEYDKTRGLVPIKIGAR